MRKQEKFLPVVLFGLVVFAPVAGAVTVTEAVKEALHTNPEVQESANEKLVRGEELRQAKAGYLPTVDLSAGVGLENTDSPYTRAAGNTGYVSLTRREASITARENVFSGMATVNDTKRQRSRVDAAEYGADATLI